MTYPKIDLAIIGAQKAGTTSLKNYLSEHPKVISHPHIEFTYFADNAEYENDYAQIYKKYFDNNVDLQKKVLVKNVTISFREYAIKRLHEHNPNCQLVFILREPVQRAFSSHQMAQRSGWMDKPFNYAQEAIQKNKNGEKDTFFRFMIDLGIYYKQIETILKYFPKEQLNVYTYEQFKDDPQQTCSDLFNLLNIDPKFKAETNKKHNEGGVPKSKTFGKFLKNLRHNNILKNFIRNIISEKQFINLSQKLTSLNVKKGERSIIDLETKAFLQEYYLPLNQKCSDLIGKDLNSIWY